MFNVILPVLSTIFSALRNRKEDIAAEAGVSGDVVEKVGGVLEAYLTKDERVWHQIAAEVEKARQHDIATQVKGYWFIDIMRGAVRPIITYVAMFWYVYARAYTIPLGAEDYAIIGGILAFWFGTRPFEKKITK